jgi:mannose-6-phosphate isomerase-like protein (cupin superfamily)
MHDGLHTSIGVLVGRVYCAVEPMPTRAARHYGRDRMPRPGDVLLDPRSGRRLIVRRTSAQTGGRLIEYAVHYLINEARPEADVQADREHILEVVDGALEASVSGRVQSLSVGDVLLIGQGEPFAVWNALPSPAIAVWQTCPALDTEALLEADLRR